MRIVHSTSIPVIAYEYRLPLVGIPAEADSEWRDWLAAFVDRDAEDIKKLVWQRFRGASAELCRLAGLVGEFTPFSLLIFEGTPLVWMEHFHEQQRDVIYFAAAGAAVCSIGRIMVLRASAVSIFGLRLPEPVANAGSISRVTAVSQGYGDSS